MTQPFSLSQQIDFVRLELFRRHLEYTPKVRRGHIPRTEAEHRIGCMQAVLNTLLELEKERAR